MKKNLKKMMALILVSVLTLCNVTHVMAAKNVYTDTEYWKTGFFNKQYWAQDNYRDNTNVITVVTLEYISKSLNWNNLGSSQSLSVEEGIEVAETTSIGLAKSLGYEYLKDGRGVSTSTTFEATKSFTTNKIHAETYSVTFTKEDKVGYYTWEARINAHKYTSHLFWRPNKRSSWEYQEKGKAFSFTTKNPYIELGYTTFAVN